MKHRPNCTHPQAVLLAHGKALAIDGARGSIVEAGAGLLWLTVEGEAGDVFLSAGQSHRVAGEGRVVIEGAARAPSTVRIHCPQSFLSLRVRPILHQGLVCLLSVARRQREWLFHGESPQRIR